PTFTVPPFDRAVLALLASFFASCLSCWRLAAGFWAAVCTNTVWPHAAATNANSTRIVSLRRLIPVTPFARRSPGEGLLRDPGTRGRGRAGCTTPPTRIRRRRPG